MPDWPQQGVENSFNFKILKVVGVVLLFFCFKANK